LIRSLVSGLFLLFLVCDGFSWPLPPPLETSHLLGPGLVAGRPPVALADELYALGWSRKNEFAVLERRSLGPGTKEIRFRILDLVEDTVVVEQTWPDWGDQGQDEWEKVYGPRLEELFSRFSLQPTSWQLGVFPLILDNEYYTPVLRTHPHPDDPTWLEGLEILIYSTGRGLKTVKKAQGYWRWATLVGFVPSPFENRLALILLVQPAGWEGKQQSLRFLVTGLSLKAGFPKP